MWETMHRHATNALIQFIQMENVLKILLNGQSVGGHLPLRPPTKMLGRRLPPSPYNRRPWFYLFWNQSQCEQFVVLGLFTKFRRLRAVLVRKFCAKNVVLFTVKCSLSHSNLWWTQCICHEIANTIRYDTRCYFNVRSKANMSRLSLLRASINWVTKQ